MCPQSRGASETVNNYSEAGEQQQQQQQQREDTCERVSLSPCNNGKYGPGLSSDENHVGDVLRDFSKLGFCRKVTTLLTSSHQFNNLQVTGHDLFFRNDGRVKGEECQPARRM